MLRFEMNWSGQQDSNLRPAVPKTAALPGYAIPRDASGYTVRITPARYRIEA